MHTLTHPLTLTLTLTHARPTPAQPHALLHLDLIHSLAHRRNPITNSLL